MKGVIFPVLLIVIILGSIYSGIASVTESAGVGAAGAVGCAAINRRLTWRNFLAATLVLENYWDGHVDILRDLSICLCLPEVRRDRLRARRIRRTSFRPMGDAYIDTIVFNISWHVYRSFWDYFAHGAFVSSIVDAFGFNQLWFGILFAVNMQIAFISPPFGAALFYLKGSAPPEITLGDIYRAAVLLSFYKYSG